MTYTLGQAATATGKSKSTIQRAIESGKISGSKDNNGHYALDPSELHRVYPPVASATVAQPAPSNDTQPQNATEEHPRNSEILEEKIKNRDEKIAFYENQIDELKIERNDWKEQAQRLAITNQKQTDKPAEGQEPNATPTPIAKPSNVSLWAFVAILTCVLGVVLALLYQRGQFVELHPLFSMFS